MTHEQALKIPGYKEHLESRIPGVWEVQILRARISLIRSVSGMYEGRSDWTVNISQKPSAPSFRKQYSETHSSKREALRAIRDILDFVGTRWNKDKKETTS